MRTITRIVFAALLFVVWAYVMFGLATFVFPLILPRFVFATEWSTASYVIAVCIGSLLAYSVALDRLMRKIWS